MGFTSFSASLGGHSGLEGPGPDGSVKGFVHSSEAGGAVDGPGLRHVLFVSGCPLRCQYCHNPDTWHMHQGKATTSAEVLAEIASYAPFLKKAHGGVTISGGEPLTQPDFVTAVLKGSKALGLHTALDTSGFLGAHTSDELLSQVDLVLLDIKAFTEATYHEVTGHALRPTLEFAERLAAMGKPIWLRYVLVPGLTDKMDEIEALAAFAAGLGTVERVDVLPFHKMGEFKWKDMGLTYRLGEVDPPSEELTRRVRDAFRAAGLKVG
jgi:pyruvate formate lyase activating enzyme